ncbi:MAG: M20/M25/M40 family metallo-hydrolase, partial [Oscillospiraceae bacterium]|nr:M20/M25/M40 family metallo-hydrolase [Oscillospiraceae bacterium]
DEGGEDSENGEDTDGSSESNSSDSGSGSSSSSSSEKKYKYVWQLVDVVNYITHSSKNVVAQIPAIIESEAGEDEEAAASAPIIIFCAHYDDVEGADGAIDNASGVASALEIARIIRAARGHRHAELRFLFSSAEEQGVYGALAYLDSLSDEEKARFAGAINLDMTAHSTDGNIKALSISTFGALTDEGYKNGAEGAPLRNSSSIAVELAYSEMSADFESPLYFIHWDKNDLRAFDRYGLDCVTLAWSEIDPERATNRFNICSPEVMHTEDDSSENLDYDSLFNTTRLALRAFEKLYDEAVYSGGRTN